MLTLQIEWVNNQGTVVDPVTRESVTKVHAYSDNWSNYVNPPTETTVHWESGSPPQ